MGSIMDQERPWKRPDYLKREQEAYRKSIKESEEFSKILLEQLKNSKWKLPKVNK